MRCWSAPVHLALLIMSLLFLASSAADSAASAAAAGAAAGAALTMRLAEQVLNLQNCDLLLLLGEREGKESAPAQWARELLLQASLAVPFTVKTFSYNFGEVCEEEEEEEEERDQDEPIGDQRRSKESFLLLPHLNFFFFYLFSH